MISSNVTEFPFILEPIGLDRGYDKRPDNVSLSKRPATYMGCNLCQHFRALVIDRIDNKPWTCSCGNRTAIKICRPFQETCVSTNPHGVIGPTMHNFLNSLRLLVMCHTETEYQIGFSCTSLFVLFIEIASNLPSYR